MSSARQSRDADSIYSNLAPPSPAELAITMTLHVALNHLTRYRYDRRVEMGPQVIRLRPAPHSRTPVPSYALKVEPKAHFLNWQQDPHGNFLARVVFPEKVSEFFVEVDLVADMAVSNPFDFFLEPEAERYPFEYEPVVRKDLEPYLAKMPAPPLLKKWLRDLRGETGGRTIDFLVELNQRLQNEIRYTIRLEPGVQTPEETLALGSGSCRDTGWLLVQILRHLGIASRFVSGYLIQLVADVKSLDGPSGAPQDFTDLHAWCEAYLPGAGWVGLDPTSGLLAGEGHIPLACTPHPVSAAPITGAIEECETTFEHKMSVRRIVESPRVTKPYSEEQWQAIDDFGHRIERQLLTDDVRVTIGGEPTFVASDDPDAAEWNTAASGPNKRVLAAELIQRLRARFAPHGLLHYGQGKWYPGEQLPRWAFSLYWRRDERPIWTDGALIADEDKDYGVTADTAREFLLGVAHRLDLTDKTVSAAYEDPWYFIGQERKLPEKLDPATSKLDDPMARTRLARVFERGLGKPVGYVLPVQRWNAMPKADLRRWISEPWTTRAGKLFLAPGDSPIGFRLPLPSLSYLSPIEFPHVVPADPFAERGELPDPHPRRQSFRRGEPAAAPPRAERVAAQVAGGGQVRTALAVEPRHGRLCVFMPPVAELEDYLDLVAAIEDASAELEMPVHLEGYDPPRDPRLNVIKVTPDPGVIEVNVQPASRWDELRAITDGIYDDARHTRLVTEKFMLDGRHTGTGGGNHVVLGGARAADSPFLRRPDLLRSLIAFWQQSSVAVVSLLRHVHRADKPGAADRRGASRLALRTRDRVRAGAEGVAAAAVARRSTVPESLDRRDRQHASRRDLHRQALLAGRSDRAARARRVPSVRDAAASRDEPRAAVAARVARRALLARAIQRRPDTLGHATARQVHAAAFHVWQDFSDVVDDMNRAGYGLDAAWFAPHFEFRFPRYGRS